MLYLKYFYTIFILINFEDIDEEKIIINLMINAINLINVINTRIIITIK